MDSFTAGIMITSRKLGTARTVYRLTGSDDVLWELDNGVRNLAGLASR